MLFSIAIEGIDGTGKETQAKAVHDCLKTLLGEDRVRLISFPDYNNESSVFVKRFLSGEYTDVTPKQASMAYAMDRFDTFNRLGVNNDDLVYVFDRYTGSNLIHQVTNAGEHADGVEAFIIEMERGVLGLPEPDITFYLTFMSKDSKYIKGNGSGKFGSDKDILETSSHQKRAYSTGLHMASTYNWLPIFMTDGNDKRFNKEVVTDRMMAIIREKLTSKNIIN